MGSSLAQHLAQENQVSVITPFPEVAPFCDETLEGHVVRTALHNAGVQVETNLVVGEIHTDCVTTADEFGRRAVTACDLVVLVTQRVSADAIYLQLDAAHRDGTLKSQLLRAGDCVAPRLAADAIFDGHRLAMELDPGSPRSPRPYRHG